MKTNKPIPQEFFNWLETLDFHSLDTIQQRQVREFLSEEEYSIMHQATSKLRQVALSAKPKGKEQIKHELLRAFDKKHGRQNRFIILLNQPVRFGAAASITLFLLTALLWQNFSANRFPVQTELPVQIDTVLVERIPAPVIVHDTVLIPYTPKKRQAHSPVPSGIKALEQELYINGTEDLSAPINQRKNTSLQADSLVEKYGFVSM
ncbi:MAG: hypothetical protein ACYC1Q_13825 [Bacteroidia bacterium]